MLSRFPHEIRLKIFHIVFAESFLRVVIRVEDTAEGIRFKFAEEYSNYRYAGAISCLDATIIGEGVAAAAAEALYKSHFTFGVDTNILCTFLQSCPLSNAVQPGRYIKKLSLYMDEDPNFIGDGRTGQDLRKADWVDLIPGPGDDRTTRSTKRTQSMRQCWRAILNMPRLHLFEFLITPSQGKASADDIQRIEIRDIIPMHFRLFCRNIDARIHVHTRDTCSTAVLDYGLVAHFFAIDHPDAQDGDFYECYMDLSSCIPRKWAKPTAEKREEAETIAARLGGRPPASWSDFLDTFKLDAIRNYDAFQDYYRRLVADKSQYLSKYFNAEMVANML